jgi:pyruvate dehydrogenase E2 component (dihydrolipoamide acetyltransferase)
MPALGQTSDELVLVAWLRAAGDQVAEGEPLLEVETDKATLEVEAALSGTLLAVVCEAGRTVTAGTVVGWIGEPGEQIPEEEEAPARKVLATPAARTLAREQGVDLAGLTGSGPDGRIERRDVLAATDQAEQPADAVSANRQAIARRLVRSTAIPQFSVSRTIDARRALAGAAAVPGATLTHVLLQAVAAALRAFPSLNRVWADDGPTFRRVEGAAVGLAIATDDNLVVATIPEPDLSSLADLAETTRRVVDEARGGRLVAGFSGPAAVTVSNLGMFGIDRFEAIVDPDQTAILACGRVVERPAITADGIVAVAQLELTLTVDHRTVDGAEAARFLAAVCAELET